MKAGSSLDVHIQTTTSGHTPEGVHPSDTLDSERKKDYLHKRHLSRENVQMHENGSQLGFEPGPHCSEGKSQLIPLRPVLCIHV